MSASSTGARSGRARLRSAGAVAAMVLAYVAFVVIVVVQLVLLRETGQLEPIVMLAFVHVLLFFPTVDVFGRRLRDEVSLDAIVEGLRATTAATFRPGSINVVLVGMTPVDGTRP